MLDTVLDSVLNTELDTVLATEYNPDRCEEILIRTMLESTKVNYINYTIIIHVSHYKSQYVLSLTSCKLIILHYDTIIV